MRRALVAASVCACLAGVVMLAPGAGSAVNTKVSISVGFKPEVGNPFFKGSVRSARASCRRGRVISIFRVKNRKRVVRFGSTRTNSKGFWKKDMAKNMVPGGYFAKAKARGTCALDTSKELAVGQGGPGGTGPGGTE